MIFSLYKLCFQQPGKTRQTSVPWSGMITSKLIIFEQAFDIPVELCSSTHVLLNPLWQAKKGERSYTCKLRVSNLILELFRKCHFFFYWYKKNLLQSLVVLLTCNKAEAFHIQSVLRSTFLQPFNVANIAFNTKI